jgi:hypothetical protein
MSARWPRPRDQRGKFRLDGSDPPYVTDNGFGVHSRHLWWQNEDTSELPDLVDRRSFDDLLKEVPPRGNPADAARKADRAGRRP